MKINTVPIAELMDDQTEAWISLLPANGPLGSPFMRPEFAAAAGRVLPNVEVAILSSHSECQGFFAFERQSGDVAVPVSRFLSGLHGVVGRGHLEWDADSLIRGSGLKAFHFDHLLADQQPFHMHHSYVDDSYFMDLSQGYDAYCSERKSNGSSAIKQAARKCRKLEREVGPVRFTAHTTDPAAWADLARWKGQQLTRLGYPDMFQLSWVNELFEELRTVREPEFSPLLSTLHAGDTMVAVHLGLQSPTVVDSWIPTFSADYSKYSPGLILQLELAKWAAEQGATRVDLGRGENQMKLSLTSGAFEVAVGAVDHRLLHRTWSRTYYGLRNLVHASPFRDASMNAVRRIKTWIS